MRVGMIAACVLFPVALGAQGDAAGRGEVHGSVYDSVARRPVVGAVVQIVSASNPAARAYSATTDAEGRYVVTGVEPGKYVGGFLDAALDSLALNAPLRPLDVLPGKRVRLDLAVPSPATLVKAFCGRDGAADSTGVVIGLLRDARTRTSVDSGTVQATWNDLVLDARGFNQYARIVTSPALRDGWFVLCGVPGEVDVGLLGWHGADSTGLIIASVATAGVVRRDLFVRGVAVIRGSVVSERNQPVPNARVGVIGRERSVATDSAGAFHLGNVPAGSQTIEVRALGFAPERNLLHLRADGDTSLAVTLTSMKKVMDTIRVIAQRLYDRDLDGFQRRKRRGGGHFFDQESIQRRRPYDVFQLLRQVPSVRMMQNGFDRTVTMRGGCSPELYLNGMRMPTDLVADLDLLAHPDEVVGLEVYSGIETPAEFSSFGSCGSIVLWTRLRPRPRR